jgi:ubiquinone/menaquinone biosynthesis C-methylase UbiE
MSSGPSTPPIEQIKAGMRATWMAGDFGMIARTNAVTAAEFAASLPLPAPPAHALDVATGTGNIAIPLAKHGLTVTGVDIAANLLAQARARAAAEGLSVRFDEGDAEALPYPDASFDMAATMFGAMFAPRPELVAAEFARVLKPGGLLAMANWTPGGFTGRTFKMTSQHLPPPPGVPAPVLWGDPAMVQQRLGDLFTDIATEPVTIEFDFPTSPGGVVEFFRKYFGPTQMTYQRLSAAGQVAYTGDLTHLWTSANTSGDPNRTIVKNEYLKVTARKK